MNSYFANSKLSKNINWEVLYYANNGRLEWLEYNIKRALNLETYSLEEQELGVNEVRDTIKHIVYYELIKDEILENCKQKIYLYNISKFKVNFNVDLSFFCSIIKLLGKVGEDNEK